MPKLSGKIVIFLTVYFGVLFFAKTTYALEAGWYTDSPAFEENLKTYASQGVTLMLPYNSSSDLPATKTYLNEANKYGIKVWVDMRLHANPLINNESG